MTAPPAQADTWQRGPALPDPLSGSKPSGPRPHLIRTPAFSFERELVTCQPALRMFARRLSRNADLADDLVQGAMLQAWAARARFQPGSSMKAWTFTILRNLHISWFRKHARIQPWDQDLADILLTTPARQEASLALGEAAALIEALPSTQRDALIMIGACGLSYGEAAALADCPVGTIKSRVARARQSLRDSEEPGHTPVVAAGPGSPGCGQRGNGGRQGLASIATMVATMTAAQDQASRATLSPITR
jgi:RNA polymerase sigma factor (sigma-70 family)